MFRALRYVALFSLLVGCATDPTANDIDPETGQNTGKADQLQDGANSDSVAGNTSDTSESDGSEDLDGAESVDPTEALFAPASDVDLHHVVFPEDLEAPDYDYPRVDSGFFLSGTEFWQKWSGGLNPTYSYSEGSDFGRRCMYASALRFKALMTDPPESIKTLKAESKWNGSFFNWNDDYALSTWGDASSARLWAWRTGLIKWISQTSADGSCYLPTKDMLETLAADCLEEAESSDGEIQGCRAP